jgi:putative flavoprotein involved in K+ transport
MTQERSPAETGDRFDTIVIGGGQAGLAVAHELQERGVDFVIIDASDRVGDAWRRRWDSLLLFTPARMNGLPGMPFPGKGSGYITKDEVADYLEEYARSNKIPIRNATRVDRLWHDGTDYVVEAGRRQLRATNVVVAMADYQVPRVPAFAPDLEPNIVQMHSSQYKNPSQLQEGGVLVVGMGNSGADIAAEVSKTHETWAAGKESGHVPFRIEKRFGRWIGVRLVRFVAIRVLNTATFIGRKARPKMLTKAAPLVRVKPKDLDTAGVHRVPRVARIEAGHPVLEDGTSLEVANVIWCTGFSPGFSWVDIPVFDAAGHPIHERGVATDQPGLYFLGLYFLHALWSETITGVQPDARHVAEHLVGQAQSSTN